MKESTTYQAIKEEGREEGRLEEVREDIRQLGERKFKGSKVIGDRSWPFPTAGFMVRALAVKSGRKTTCVPNACQKNSH